LGIGFERCENKGEKSAPKFVPSSNYHKEEKALKPIKTHYDNLYKPRTMIKAQALSDFMAEWIETQTPPKERELEYGPSTLMGPYNFKVQEQEYW
jgi:hypothetical protein